MSILADVSSSVLNHILFYCRQCVPKLCLFMYVISDNRHGFAATSHFLYICYRVNPVKEKHSDTC